MRTSLIITAGGTGERFGFKNGKLFFPINGLPMIIHTVRAFADFDFQDKIITFEKSQLTHLEKLLIDYDIRGYKIAAGGRTRKESVINAFNLLRPCAAVVIHDGARPNIKKPLIEALIAAAKTNQAVIPGIPVADTIKEINDLGFVVNTPERKNLIAVQTPQVFDYHTLKAVYEKTKNLEITDEAKLFEACALPVKVIPGDPANIKITYQQDAAMLSAFDTY